MVRVVEKENCEDSQRHARDWRRGGRQHTLEPTGMAEKDKATRDSAVDLLDGRT